MRGDVYLAAQKGSQTQKMRPVVIIQNSVSLASHALIAVCLITSTLRPLELYRISIAPGDGNGLDRPSQVMIDRIFAFDRASLRSHVGTLSPADLSRVDDALRRWLEL